MPFIIIEMIDSNNNNKILLFNCYGKQKFPVVINHYFVTFKLFVELEKNFAWQARCYNNYYFVVQLKPMMINLSFCFF